MKAVSKTAWYCCGVRLQDAKSMHPVLNDQYAERLMGSDGMQYWEEFKDLKGPNASNVARHYIIEQNLRPILHQHADTTVILIGAGLDSRAYRLPGGNWVEIDDPALIEYKNQALPVTECKNSLERIAVDFEKEKLLDKLMPYVNRSNVVVIIEGVLMYLGKEQKEELLNTLTACFPKHILYCNLMGKKFFEKFSRQIHEKLSGQGSSFTDITDEPEQVFLRYGYSLMATTPILPAANELQLVRIPKFIINFLYKKLMRSYSIHTFNYG